MHPFVADVVSILLMKSLTKEKMVLHDRCFQFNLHNIGNIHFEEMVHRIYPPELQLNKAYTSDTEAAFFSDLNLSIHNDTVSTKTI